MKLNLDIDADIVAMTAAEVAAGAVTAAMREVGTGQKTAAVADHRRGPRHTARQLDPQRRL